MSRMTSFFVLQPIVFASLAMAGPYDSYLTTGVAPTSITAWANAVDDYSPTAEVVEFDMFGGGPHNVPANGLGPADGVTVSLGDLDTAAINSGTAPGSITVHFQETLLDGPGADFAVFENAGAFFNSHDVNFLFAELAFVEVSSNGLDYARFPAISLNIDEEFVVVGSGSSSAFAVAVASRYPKRVLACVCVNLCCCAPGSSDDVPPAWDARKDGSQQLLEIHDNRNWLDDRDLQLRCTLSTLQYISNQRRDGNAFSIAVHHP